MNFAGQSLIGVVAAKYAELDIRCKIALGTAESFQERGISLIVSDGGSPEFVKAAFRQRGATVIDASRPGLATQYLDAVHYILENGGGSASLLKLEPEKAAMLENGGLERIMAALAKYDIVVIGRTDAAIATLPSMQRRTELLGGKFMERLGLPADALSGGRAFTPRGVEEWLRYERLILEDPAKYNNWLYLYLVPLWAMAQGLSVGGTLVDLYHPKEMVEEEEGNSAFDAKRIEQLRMQIVVMAHHYPIGDSLDTVSKVLTALALELSQR
jgi:hypothetical protein